MGQAADDRGIGRRGVGAVDFRLSKKADGRIVRRFSTVLAARLIAASSPARLAAVLVTACRDHQPSRRWRQNPLLVFVRLDFSDDVEIGSIRLDHEKFTHRDCVFQHKVRDIEVMSNHHQARRSAVL